MDTHIDNNSRVLHQLSFDGEGLIPSFQNSELCI